MVRINRIKEIIKEKRIGVDVTKVKQQGIKITKAVIRWIKFKCLYPCWYWLYSHKSCNPKKVIFLEHRYDKISNSYQLLYDALVSGYDFEVHIHFLKEGFVGGFESVLRCMRLIKDLATASYLFVSDGSGTIGCLNVRPETKVLNTWHGCGAFKRFGYSTADLIFGDTRKGMQKYPTHKNYTYVTVSSPEVVWAYEEAMHLEGDDVVKSVGVSRTDIFYNNEFRRRASRMLYNKIPQAANKKVILYAPTFRGCVSAAKAPNMLNIEMLQQELADKYVLLIKHHPFVKYYPETSPECQKFAFDVSGTMTIDELLCVSDVCISDYSSLIFEYSLFERPMLFFAYDLDEYCDWRGFYYDYNELTPGPVCKTTREMIDYILHIEERFDPTIVQRFRQKFMSSCDGHATERILKLMFGEELAKNKRMK